MAKVFNPTAAKKHAEEMVTSEIEAYRDEQVFVTERIAFNMREVIKEARKNYYGIFGNPRDRLQRGRRGRVTQEDKYSPGLTESQTEGVVKSIDFDTRDIHISPEGPEDVNAVKLFRHIFEWTLDILNFPEQMNDMARRLAIDGTVVAKSWKGFNKRLNRVFLESRNVDLLNFFIDPSAHSIEEAPAVIERGIFKIADFRRMAEQNDWEDWEDVEGQTEAALIEDIISQTNFGISAFAGRVPFVTVFERWGDVKVKDLPPSERRKGDKDKDWVPALIVMSGFQDSQPTRIHKIMRNPFPDGRKPYEEAWFKKVPGRWHGRGIGEMLFADERYLRAIMSTRKNNGLVLQNGIFLIRRGSGITPEMMKRVVAGGGIPVSDVNRDIRQLPVQDFRPSSYTDEDRVHLWAQRKTGATALRLGEAIPGSTTATVGALQQRNAEAVFEFIRQGFGGFLKRLFERHWSPIILETLKPGDLFRIHGNTRNIKEFSEAVARNLVLKNAAKFQFKEDAIEAEQELRARLSSLPEMFVKLSKGFDPRFDFRIDISSERFNRFAIVQQLKELLFVAPRIPGLRVDPNEIMMEILSILKVPSQDRFLLQQPLTPQGMPPTGVASQPGPQPPLPGAQLAGAAIPGGPTQ